MKILITRTPPVDPELGIRKGQTHTTAGSQLEGGCWILGRGGEPVKVLSDEFEILDPEEQGVPKGFYVVRGGDRVIVGLEIVRGNPFRNTRLKMLLHLSLSEQLKLHESWTDGDDREKWEWDSKMRLSMSSDIIHRVDEDLGEDDPKRGFGLHAIGRRMAKATGVMLPITVIKESTRSFVEVVIIIIKEPGG